MIRVAAVTAALACAHPAPAPERAYADVNGVHMYYEIHGQGRPVLMLHGGITDHSFWPQTLQDMAKGHRVIAPEQMGHGHTADLRASSATRRWPRTRPRCWSNWT